MFDYIGKIKQMWKVIWNSKEKFSVKVGSVFSGVAATIGFLFKAAVSFPIRSIFTSDANMAAPTVTVLIADPNHEIEKIRERWEKTKDQIGFESQNRTTEAHDLKKQAFELRKRAFEWKKLHSTRSPQPQNTSKEAPQPAPVAESSPITLEMAA